MLVFVAVPILVIIASYSIVKPQTTQLNLDLGQKFSKIIAIPEKIHAPQFGYNQTIYRWEMETPQNEHVDIDLTYNPAFSKNEDTIVLTLDSPQGSDPSIYRKVLPALIVDTQSLSAAQDTAHANLNANKDIGYSKINLTLDKAGQTTKISWEFKKANLGDKIQNDYNNIYKIPNALFKILFPIPNIIVDIFKG